MEWQSNSGYVATIDWNGLSSIERNGVQVAAGGLQLIDGLPFYDKSLFYSSGFTPKLESKSIAQTSAGVVVVHEYSGTLNAKAVFSYSFSGDDITISVLVTNLSTSKSIQITGVQTPRLLFDSWPPAAYQGFTHNQSNGWAVGQDFCYPSTVMPFGGGFLSSDAAGGIPLGFGMWNTGDQFDKVATMSGGIHPLPGRALWYLFLGKEIPPEGARRFSFKIRLHPSTDYQNLLGGYKDHLRAFLPPMVGRDVRPIAQFASISTASVRPDNPYGYNDAGNGTTRRFDKAAGVADYISKMVSTMTTVGFQGIICWQPQGINPKGGQYRADFTNFPPEVLANLDALISGFTSQGLKFGLQARPGVFVTTGTWNADSFVKATDCKEHVDGIKQRLQWAIDKGVSGWYLDSFPADSSDHNVLKAMQAKVGPSSHLFTEHRTALSVAISGGGYATMSYSNGAYNFQKSFNIMRWLYPEAVWFTAFVGPLPPGGYETLYADMFALKLTPLVQDHHVMNPNWIAQMTPLKTLVSEKIASNHDWR